MKLALGLLLAFSGFIFCVRCSSRSERGHKLATVHEKSRAEAQAIFQRGKWVVESTTSDWESLEEVLTIRISAGGEVKTLKIRPSHTGQWRYALLMRENKLKVFISFSFRPEGFEEDEANGDPGSYLEPKYLP